jgi:hypothetical protein
MTPATAAHGPLAASAAGGPPGPEQSGPGRVGPEQSGPEQSGMDWPVEEAPDQRPDWRERFALGTDLALIGVVVTAAGLPVLTLPAALAAGSTAVRHRYRFGRLPAFRPLLRQFRRALLPGIPFAVVALLLLVDLIAVSRGRVPGGTPVFTATAVAACWLMGFATLVLVAVGRRATSALATPGSVPDGPAPGTSALRWAWEQATARPWSALAPALAGVLAFFLALSVPATIPLVIGFHLFAAHVISDRLAPQSM